MGKRRNPTGPEIEEALAAIRGQISEARQCFPDWGAVCEQLYAVADSANKLARQLAYKWAEEETRRG